MKKLIAFIAIAFMGVSAQAQTYTAIGSDNVDRKIKAAATLTNAATDTTRFTITSARHDYTIYVPVRKTSGTISGTVRYFYSGDGGLTWYLAETDSLTDATNVYTYEKNYLPSNRWMVITQTVGTSVSTQEVWLRSNK